MKKLNLMGAVLLGIALGAALPSQAQTTSPTSSSPQAEKSGWIIKSYKVDDLGYGYEIIDGATNQVIIRQTVIPGVQGIYRFETDADAQKTGRMAANIMNKGIFPPTITFKNMDSVNVSLTKVKPEDKK